MMENMEMTPQEYIESLVAELMVDPEWMLPPPVRGFIMMDLEWSLLMM